MHRSVRTQRRLERLEKGGVSGGTEVNRKQTNSPEAVPSLSPGNMKKIHLAVRIFIIFSAVLLIAWAAMALLASPAADHPYFDGVGFQVIAHRGGRGLGPENTLFTFRLAVELGVDVLEMDVRRTGDGHLVISHDKTVDRTTDASGPVANYTLADLKQLDAAYRWSPDNGRSFPYRNHDIRIPTLSEVFEAFPGTRMNLEIKASGIDDIHDLCRTIRNHAMAATVMVASFDTGVLKRFRTVCPEVATSAGASEAIVFNYLQRVHLEAVYSPTMQALQVPETYRERRVVDERFLEAAHHRNLRVQVWTVNDADSMKRLLELGVDGIMTDYPDRLLALLKAAGPG